MVEFVHEIIQCLVNANIKLKLQIWISRYPCSNVVRRNKTSLSTINWSPYWVKDDAITKKLKKNNNIAKSVHFVKIQPPEFSHKIFLVKIYMFFFYIIHNLRNIFPFINNIYFKYIRKNNQYFTGKTILELSHQKLQNYWPSLFSATIPIVLNHKLHVRNYGDVSIWVNNSKQTNKIRCYSINLM